MDSGLRLADDRDVVAFVVCSLLLLPKLNKFLTDCRIPTDPLASVVDELSSLLSAGVASLS